MYNRIIILAASVLIVATSCGVKIEETTTTTLATTTTTIITIPETTTTTTPLHMYLLNHPRLQRAIEEGQADMEAVSIAANSGNVMAVNSACETLSLWANRALSDYEDVPSPSLVSAFQHVVDGSQLCLEGNYSGSAAHIRASGNDFRTAAAQVTAEG